VTKNKIDSSGIEVTVKELSESDNTRVKDLASNVPLASFALLTIASTRMGCPRNGIPDIKTPGTLLSCILAYNVEIRQQIRKSKQRFHHLRL